MGRFAINFATGLINGGLREWKAAKAEQDKRDLDTLSKATPETRQQYTEADGQQLEAIANARDASGNPIYELTANPDASYGVRVAGDGGGSAATISPKATTTFLGKTFAGQPTDRQVQDTRMRAMANVLARSNPAQAQAMLTGMDVADRERERADRESVDNRELRAVLAGGGAAQAVASAAIGAGSGQSMPVAGGAFPATEAGQAVQAAASPPSPWAGQQTPAAYMRTAVPNVVTTLMRQGKFDQAQKFMKFADSAIGQEYATAWHDGVMRLSAGDSAGAIKTFERLYNSNLLPDGRQVRMTPAQDGSGRFTATVYDGDGKVVGQQQGTAEQLASQAAVMLSPTNAVQFHAKAMQEDRRQAATLDRQEQLETLRQEGRAAADARSADRLDRQIAAQNERLQMSIEAQDQRLGRTLEARAGNTRPLTAAQQRSNQEIDAARETIRGLTPEEIRRRTSKATNTGRENPDYDPGLARAAGLANRRKVGEDDQFDNALRGPEQRQQQDAATRARQQLITAFRADRSMAGRRLGRETPHGMEVLDANGKVTGYYSLD